MCTKSNIACDINIREKIKWEKMKIEPNARQKPS